MRPALTRSLEKFRKEVPAGVLELFAVPGLQPDKIMKLYETLSVSSLAELEAAAKEDRIRAVKGLGASLQTKILQNLAIARSGQTQFISQGGPPRTCGSGRNGPE